MKAIINDTPIDVVIIRKSNKNIYMRVKDDLKLYITCPYLITRKELEDLIEKNTFQIYEMYEKQIKHSQKSEFFNYLGKSYTVVIDYTRDEVGFQDDFVYAKNKEQLNTFYSLKCEEIFNEEIDKCKQCFRNLPSFTLKIRKMKTRWGVCNRRSKTITLNSLLLEHPIDAIDYVIIHEMCHFFEGNHGRKFWELVSLACPRYKELRKSLKE